MADEKPLAIVFTYIPDPEHPTNGEVYYTAFDETARNGDPLSFAHLFRESEEERGDFPGSIWTVTGNDAAAEIRTNTIMARFGMADEPTKS